MTIQRMRGLVVWSSILIVGLTVFFFILAPAFGYRLEYADVWPLAKPILPVFLGFLGIAVQFIGQDSPGGRGRARRAPPLLLPLVAGPIGIYLLGFIALVVAYGVTNRADAPLGEGMSKEDLSTWITVLLGILAATTNAAVAILFRTETKA